MRPRRSGGPFLYGAVAAEIRRRIARGVYAPGGKIPSQAELTREFNVSAITVRRALHELTYEGLLFGHQGLGVFVAAPRRIQRVLGGASWSTMGDEIRRAGFEPSMKELSMARVAAPPHVVNLLGLPPGAVVWRHEKSILADSDVVSLHRLYLPLRLGERLRGGLASEFMFALLHSEKIRYERIDFQFRGAALGEEEAPVFGLPIGFPLIIVQFVPVGTGGEPLLVGEAVCRADKFTFDVSVTPRPISGPDAPAADEGASARRRGRRASRRGR